MTFDTNRYTVGNSLNELTQYLSYKLIDNGTRTPSRNGDTYELTDQEIILLNPKARHLYLEGRKNSLGACLAEIFWLMSGTNELDPLMKFFLPRCTDFSDDGKTWTNGYGTKLYTHGNLDNVIQSFLQDGKNTRRSMMAIWTPETDTIESLSKKGFHKPKDISCFPGYTKLWTSNGKCSIKDINIGDLVYSFNEKSKCIELNKVIYSGKTKTVDKFLRITLDSGECVDVTHDHLMYVKAYGKNIGKGLAPRIADKTIRADGLKVNDKILKTIIHVENKRFLLKRNLHENTHDSNWEKPHYSVLQYHKIDVPKGFIVHHKDENPSNNTLENLEIMESYKHNSHHLYKNNPSRNIETLLKRSYYHSIFPGIINGPYFSDWDKDYTLEFVYKAFKEGYLPSLDAEIYRENCTELGLPAPGTLVKIGFLSYFDFIKCLNKKYQDIHLICKGRRKPNKKPCLGKIVKIEEITKTEDVYDLTVENNHNFILESGWVVHNCNNTLWFWIRDNKLNLKVGVRSNDLIWGFSAINIPEWTFLQEIVLAMLKNNDPDTFGEVTLGYYHHSVISFHLYDFTAEQAKELLKNNGLQETLSGEHFDSIKIPKNIKDSSKLRSFFQDIYLAFCLLIKKSNKDTYTSVDSVIDSVFQYYGCAEEGNQLYYYAKFVEKRILEKQKVTPLPEYCNIKYAGDFKNAIEKVGK